MERSRTPGTRRVGVPPPEFANDFHTSDRSHNFLGTAAGSPGRKSMRRRRRGGRDAGDRARSASPRGGSGYGGRGQASALADRPGRRAGSVSSGIISRFGGL